MAEEPADVFASGVCSQSNSDRSLKGLVTRRSANCKKLAPTTDHPAAPFLIILPKCVRRTGRRESPVNAHVSFVLTKSLAFSGRPQPTSPGAPTLGLARPREGDVAVTHTLG